MTTKIIANYDPKNLKQEILAEARTISLPEGFANAIADEVIKQITPWLKSKPTITATSLNKKVAAIIKKYHADLAYLFENRGKII